MKVTVQQYYRGFGSWYALAAGIPFAPLLFRACVPDSSTIAEYLYPPLGDVQQLAFAATVFFLLLTTIMVFACNQGAQKIRPSVYIILGVGFLFGVCALIGLYVPYVRRVPVPAAGLEVPLSIGYQRTDFALRWYPQESDWEMLHNTGPYEEKIQELWTPNSIFLVRGLLWLSYTLTLACFLATVSLAVYQHAAEGTPSESKVS
jgi:heme/copper-type cytochrome/quinol oxidase subunit 3